MRYAADGLLSEHIGSREKASDHSLSFYSFGFEKAKDTAGCRAHYLNTIVGGKNKMNPFDDTIIDYAGYRYTVVEEKIEQCLSTIWQGATSVTINRDDLTDDELRYLEKEVQRRVGI